MSANATIEAFVQAVDRERVRHNISIYRLAQQAGVTIDCVRRFFHGYQGTDRRIRDDSGPGRVRLDTAVRLAEAVGLRIEVHATETTPETFRPTD